MTDAAEKKTFLGVAGHHHIRNGTSFALIVISALYFKWEAKDIIWGLWASSLSIGYALILIGSLQGLFIGKVGERVVAAISLIFTIPFFTVHFGGFHLGHAAFLMHFFPVNAPLPSETYHFLSRRFVALSANQELLTYIANLVFIFKSYWIVVAVTFISRYGDFKKIVTGKAAFNFISPYANVIRMHVLIFIFAGMNAANLDRYVIYPVLLLYFFPWGELFFKRKKDLLPIHPRPAKPA